MLLGGRRVLFVPTSHLVKPESFYTLDMPFNHRPDIVGISVYDADPEKLQRDKSVHILRTRQRVEPESVVIERSNTQESSKTNTSKGAESATDADADGPPTMPNDETQDASEVEDKEKLFKKSDSADLGNNLLHPTEEMRRNVLYEKARFKQEYLLTEAGAMVRCFNMELRTLSHQKVHLDLLLKRAGLNLLTLYEEYKMLKEFEKSEQSLAAAYEERIEDKRVVQIKVSFNLISGPLPSPSFQGK